jgi:hypothetical protein
VQTLLLILAVLPNSLPVDSEGAFHMLWSPVPNHFWLLVVARAILLFAGALVFAFIEKRIEKQRKNSLPRGAVFYISFFAFAALIAGALFDLISFSIYRPVLPMPWPRMLLVGTLRWTIIFALICIWGWALSEGIKFSKKINALVFIPVFVLVFVCLMLFIDHINNFVLRALPYR